MVNTSTEYDMTKWFKGAIYVDQYYGVDSCLQDEEQPRTDATPTIRDIAFRNITFDTVRGYGIYLCGLPENLLQNIQFENIRGCAPYAIYEKNQRETKWNNVCIVQNADVDAEND